MKKGELWFVDLPSVSGHEQEGVRPVFVVAKVEGNLVVGIPCTSNKKVMRFPDVVKLKSNKLNGLLVDTYVLVFQIRAIDIKRFKRKLGVLEDKQIKQIDIFLKKMLGLI